MRILYLRPSGIGWQSVTHFALLAAELLGAELTTIDWLRPRVRLQKLGALVPVRKHGEKLLVIAPHPEHLLGVVSLREWFRGSEFTAALITDSVFVERAPTMLGRSGHYDHLFVPDGDYVDDWQRVSGLPVTWVPHGSDVLRHGSGGSDRPIDLLRVGRQPPAWDNDDDLVVRAQQLDIKAAGRPPMFDDARVGYPRMMQALSTAKITIAFGSRVNPVPYAHPEREMLTYRWVDAIAAGTVVAGVAPVNRSARELLWPEAVVEVSPSDLEAGLETIQTELSTWRSARPQALYARALRTLDWRWRLKQIAQVMEVESPLLDAEIQVIEERLASQ